MNIATERNKEREEREGERERERKKENIFTVSKSISILQPN